VVEVQAGNNHIVERDLAGGLQGDNQGAPFFKMLSKIVRRGLERERAKPVVFEVVLQIGSEDPMRPGRIETPLNLFDVGCRIQRPTLLALPELHDHRYAGSAAPVLFLLHERNIQPHSGRLGCAHETACAQ